MNNMDFVNFEVASDALQAEAWTLYEDSFPYYERRSPKAHDAALANADFHCELAVGEGGVLYGLLCYWLCDTVLFVEHIAVEPSLRGRNIGSEIIKYVLKIHSGKAVILEVEPPKDENARRRMKFYERLGFVANDCDYCHPSYSTGDAAHPHRLVLMSYGHRIEPDEMEVFRNRILLQVLSYVD